MIVMIKNTLKNLGALFLASVAVASCAKMDPRIGTKLFPDDESGKPIAFVKTEMPKNVISADLVYLLAENKYKDAEELSKPIEIPVYLTAPADKDVKVKLVFDGESADGEPVTHLSTFSKDVVTIKAGETVSSEKFLLSLPSDRMSKVGKISERFRIIKASEDEGFSLSTNLNTITLVFNYSESFEGIVEILDKVDPSWTKIDMSSWGTDWYGGHTKTYFDGDLTTGDQIMIAYGFTIRKIDARISTVVIYPKFKADGSVDLASGFYEKIDIELIDKGNQHTTVLANGIKYNMDVKGATIKDPRPLIIHFKTPVYVENLSIRHSNASSFGWSDYLNIGEIEGYL